MNERERILDLVKQGVISTEEALMLLENLAQDKSTAEQHTTTQTHTERKTAEPKLDAEPEKVDNTEQLNELQEQLRDVDAQLKDAQHELKAQQEHLQVLDTMEDLETLSADKLADRDRTKESIGKAESKIAVLNDEKAGLQKQVTSLHKAQFDHYKERLTDKLNLGDDWKDNATDTLNQVGEKVGEASGQFGKFIKNTAQSIMENVDWKEVNIRVPGIATTKFDHDFVYENASATILDVKVANGDVNFKTWDSPDIKVSAHVKLFGKMESDSSLENFLQRSELANTADTLTFKVPNKRIQADLTFYLPARTYDHTTIKLLNGNVTLEGFEGDDLFIKSTNGQLTFNSVNASMLEVEGINGNIKVNGGRLIDALVNTVNGEVRFTSNVESAELTTVNGDVKATLTESALTKLVASSVNGNVKVALPTELALSGKSKTRFGAIKTRLSNVEVLNERHNTGNSIYDFERDLGATPAKLELSTTSGNILLKDTQN
ncbi:daptomycin-sensing surface protein LiaX [Loigolactobacillus jiayinensis]|uniref:Daptomycin-sensing surface protein LiaX n=1 Tax=Loigolactobacillus jiayinensis TaxID=2486016 RepID=A0ABW1RE31_9LACO|nr:daptomycin-sensing surface protein LiaX [Loigolactobacillus jiayinensis]